MTVNVSLYIDYCDLSNAHNGFRRSGNSTSLREIDNFVETAERAIGAVELEIERFDDTYCTLEQDQDNEDYKKMAAEMKQWVEWVKNLRTEAEAKMMNEAVNKPHISKHERRQKKH